MAINSTPSEMDFRQQLTRALSAVTEGVFCRRVRYVHIRFIALLHFMTNECVGTNKHVGFRIVEIHERCRAYREGNQPVCH